MCDQARNSDAEKGPLVSNMGTSKLTEDEYTALFDRIARSDGGLDFLREHARRTGEVGQSQLATGLTEMRRLFEDQTVLTRSASRADVLRRELQEMAATIEQARREVAALQPKNTDNNRLMIATHELDAIVSMTERASFDILQSAERLMELAGKARKTGTDPELCDSMDAAVTDIFTACSFQDLTGQRTSKVVGALRYVEQRVLAMMNLWSGEIGSFAPIPEGPTDNRPDAHLMSGPTDHGVNQNDVDALMSGAVLPPSPPPPPLSRKPDTAASAHDDTIQPVPLDQSDIDNMFG